MPTPVTLTTTLRLPGKKKPVVVTTPASQRGAQARHTKAVQLALDLPKLSSPGRAVKIGPDPRRTPKPSKIRSKGKGWQRWTEKDGTVRYGVASETSPWEAGAGSSANGARTVVPADGGPLFAIFRTDPGNSSDWAREGDGILIRPALLQDCLPGLLVSGTVLAA
ncbi:hypothetical protein [Kitasatospora sp. NPDC087315]|uniref:hypothetical protein n=1 Tax=Kitasatospora sp. NPDC087315 TaxID=3364069 RepID=UPI0037F11CBF